MSVEINTVYYFILSSTASMKMIESIIKFKIFDVTVQGEERSQASHVHARFESTPHDL